MASSLSYIPQAVTNYCHSPPLIFKVDLSFSTNKLNRQRVRRNKNEKNKMYIFAITLSVLLLVRIAPFSTTNATTEPTVMNDVWFVGIVAGT
jgi:hypothetical protein